MAAAEPGQREVRDTLGLGLGLANPNPNPNQVAAGPGQRKAARPGTARGTHWKLLDESQHGDRLRAWS